MPDTIGTVRYSTGTTAMPAMFFLATAIAVQALLGVLAGLVWSAVAPATRYVLTDAGPRLADPHTQTLIEADGWFFVVTGGVGLTCGAIGYLVGWRWPFAVLAGLVGGGLLGGYVTLLVGRAVGEAVETVAAGATVTSARDVTAFGVLFAWPTLATAVFWTIEFVLACWDRDSHRMRSPNGVTGHR